METERRTIGLGGALNVICAARAGGKDVSIPLTGSLGRIAAPVAGKAAQTNSFISLLPCGTRRTPPGRPSGAEPSHLQRLASALNTLFNKTPLSAAALILCVMLSIIVAETVEVENWLMRRGLIYRR